MSIAAAFGWVGEMSLMGRDRFGLAMHLLLVEWRGWTAQMINFLTGIALAASPLASAQRPMGHVF